MPMEFFLHHPSPHSVRRWRRGFLDRSGSRSFGSRLQQRHPSALEKLHDGRGNCVQLRRRISFFVAQHRCSDASSEGVVSRLSRKQGGIHHCRRRRGGSRYTSSHTTPQKTSCRKGYSFRRWTAAKEAYKCVAGSGHGRFDEQLAPHFKAAGRDLREAEGPGSKGPSSNCGSGSNFGSVFSIDTDSATSSNFSQSWHAV